MSSCANAKGIAGSSAHPSATDAPSGTNRDTASARVTRLSVLAAFVLGLSLPDESLHALARVLALEETDERLALDREPLRERGPESLHGRVFDLTFREAGAVGVRLRPLDGPRLQLGRGDDLVDQARVLRLLRRKGPAGEHQ